MARDGVLTRAIVRQGLLDEEAERGERWVESFAVVADFCFDKLRDCFGGKNFVKCRCPVIRKAALKVGNALLQAFFWYLCTWLIFLVVVWIKTPTS